MQSFKEGVLRFTVLSDQCRLTTSNPVGLPEGTLMQLQ